MQNRSRWTAAVALIAATSLAVGACGGDSGSSGGSGGGSSTGSGEKVDLAAAGCPSTIVVQTDWNPESEHGHLYQMVGPNPQIDANKKSVTGDLYANGKATGVKLEVRSGGPAIGFSTVSSQMYQDKSITLGYVNTDEAIQFSGKLPTTAVFSENDKWPQMIMWDPKTYPDVTTIEELGKALPANKGVVRYFGGAAYMEYLTGSGILPKDLVDGTYDGTPAKFVTDKGKSAQQGFATAEPYIYENQVQAWGKPVKYQLISETGWDPYPEAMSVRTGDMSKLSGCLKALVPVMQQADVDFLKDPTATNKLIVDLVNAYNNGWTYDEQVGSFAVKEMLKLGIASDAGNAYIGDMDEARVAKLIKEATPIYSKTKGAEVKSGLKPTDLFTNEYLSKDIGLGSAQ